MSLCTKLHTKEKILDYKFPATKLIDVVIYENENSIVVSYLINCYVYHEVWLIINNTCIDSMRYKQPVGELLDKINSNCELNNIISAYNASLH